MSVLAIVLITGLGTYLIRVSGVAAIGATRALPPRVEQALRLVAPAVLAALVADSLFFEDSALRPLGAWYGAAVVAALVSWRFRSVGWTLVAGMVGVWVLTALG